jgi:hypothetical protein
MSAVFMIWESARRQEANNHTAYGLTISRGLGFFGLDD